MSCETLLEWEPILLFFTSIIISLFIIALAVVIITLIQIQSFIQYHKEYMINSQLYISEARDITYKTRDIIKAMRDKYFEDFLNFHMKSKK